MTSFMSLHSGAWIAPNYTVLHNIEHEVLIEKMKSWKALGVSLFGGGCGFGPEYISTISAWIEEENSHL